MISGPPSGAENKRLADCEPNLSSHTLGTATRTVSHVACSECAFAASALTRTSKMVAVTGLSAPWSSPRLASSPEWKGTRLAFLRAQHSPVAGVRGSPRCAVGILVARHRYSPANRLQGYAFLRTGNRG